MTVVSRRTAAVAAAVALLCGLAILGAVIIFTVGHRLLDSTAPQADRGRPGGEENPIAVGEGEGFEIDGIEYAARWHFAYERGETVILDLTGTSTADEERYVWLTFRFYRGEQDVGRISCHPPRFRIDQGGTADLSCSGSIPADLPAWDRVEVIAQGAL